MSFFLIDEGRIKAFRFKTLRFKWTAHPENATRWLSLTNAMLAMDEAHEYVPTSLLVVVESKARTDDRLEIIQRAQHIATDKLQMNP